MWGPLILMGLSVQIPMSVACLVPKFETYEDFLRARGKKEKRAKRPKRVRRVNSPVPLGVLDPQPH